MSLITQNPPPPLPWYEIAAFVIVYGLVSAAIVRWLPFIMAHTR